MFRTLIFLAMVQPSLSFGATPSKALAEKILNEKVVVSEAKRLNEKYAYHCAIPVVEGDIMWEECKSPTDFDDCTFSVMVVCSEEQERIWGTTRSGEVKITSIHVD